MPFKSLGNPFDGESDLTHGPSCTCPICVFAREQAQANYECSETEMTAKLEQAVFEGADQPQDEATAESSQHNPSGVDRARAEDANKLESSEDILDRIVESAGKSINLNWFCRCQPPRVHAGGGRRCHGRDSR